MPVTAIVAVLAWQMSLAKILVTAILTMFTLAPWAPKETTLFVIALPKKPRQLERHRCCSFNIFVNTKMTLFLKLNTLKQPNLT